MNRPVIVLRPEPGATATLARARRMGLNAHACPLFEIQPLAWDPVARGRVDAVLLGSANALRHGGIALEEYRGLPAYAVGAATAQAAARAGLDVVHTGSGGLQPMLAMLHPDHRRLLRLAGRERVELNVPHGTVMHTRDVYASVPLPLPHTLPPLLAGGALVLLHSGEAAAHFSALCRTAGIARERIQVAAIGPRVAGRAGAGWAALRSAAEATDSALLALAAEMCKEAA